MPKSNNGTDEIHGNRAEKARKEKQNMPVWGSDAVFTSSKLVGNKNFSAGKSKQGFGQCSYQEETKVKNKVNQPPEYPL